MSALVKWLFVFFVAVMLVSIIAGYAGISRLQRDHYPPFNEEGVMYTVSVWYQVDSNLILYLSSEQGKIVVGYLAVAVPLICGISLKKKKWRLGCFAVLISCAFLFSWIGIKIFLHAIYDSFPAHL